MKMTNKKGFTIVELVIVVAVIAILSAVLIPTVAGLVKKANLTSDQAAARQMNEALAALEKAPANLEEAVNALEAAGYNAKKMLVPVTKGHSFIWLADKNMVILVDNNETENNYADDVLVYPAEVDDFLVAMNNVGTKNFDLEGGVAYIDVSASKADDFESALAAGTQDIKITKDITLKYASNLLVPAGANVTVDLGGKTLTSKQNTGRHTYAMDVAGTVTIKNGTVDSRGIGVMDGGKLIIGEGVTVNAIDDNGGACVWVYEGGEVVINGGNFNAPNGPSDKAQSPGCVYNAGGKVTINGGTFKSATAFTYAINNVEGTMVINGGTFEAYRGVIANVGGNLTINGGRFETKGGVSSAGVVYCEGTGVVTVNAGSFFAVAPTSYFHGAGKIIVKKGVVAGTETYAEDKTFN